MAREVHVDVMKSIKISGLDKLQEATNQKGIGYGIKIFIIRNMRSNLGDKTIAKVWVCQVPSKKRCVVVDILK